MFMSAGLMEPGIHLTAISLESTWSQTLKYPVWQGDVEVLRDVDGGLAECGRLRGADKAKSVGARVRLVYVGFVFGVFSPCVSKADAAHVDSLNVMASIILKLFNQ